MALTDNERLQEIVLVAGDKVSLVNKKLWYALLVTIVGSVPLYYLAKASFVKLAVSSYEIPTVISNPTTKQPLQVTAKGFFDLGNGRYSAYVKVRNNEYDWGVPSQGYIAEFKTLGGTTITKVDGFTYILPSKEKLIVFSNFPADQKPEQLIFKLEESRYVHKPQISFDYELERTSIHTSGMVVSAGIKNLTPFTIKEVSLPMVIYNNRSEIIAVNSTYINDLLSGETRTFQYFWPKAIIGGIRVEISPEVNIFDRNVFKVESGGSPF